ncbi:MAG: cyclase family protein [Afipia sp.]|nr:cyclase family protein [Afipia sp.]
MAKYAVKEVVDLSHEFFEGMPNIAGLPVTFWPVETIAHTRKISDGKLGIESKMMLLPEHCGTHFDAPRHFDPNGLTTENLPANLFVMPGHLLDLTHKKNGEAITIADLEQAEAKSGKKIGPGQATIIWTGVDKDWGKPGFHLNRPFVPVPTAEWLVKRNISLFCTDLIGMDDPQEWWWPTHEVWLKAGICMVQQLCNLHELADKEFLFISLPLKMRGGTASPVRPIAVVLS